MKRINPRSPGIRALMSAAFKEETGATADELAERSGLTKGSVQAYIAPLLGMGMLHISGWRRRTDGQNNFVREYLPGPQIVPIPPHPAWWPQEPAVEDSDIPVPHAPHDPILFALLGIQHTEERKAAA